MTVKLRDETFEVPDKSNVETWYKVGGVQPDEDKPEPLRSIDYSCRFFAALLGKPVEWFYPCYPEDVSKTHVKILKTWQENAAPFGEAPTNKPTGEPSTT